MNKEEAALRAILDYEQSLTSSLHSEAVHLRHHWYAPELTQTGSTLALR